MYIINFRVGLKFYGNPSGTHIILVYPECLSVHPSSSFHPPSIFFLSLFSHLLLSSSFQKIINTKNITRMACICGCDAEHHLYNLPSRPPSPNTTYENIYAPNLAEILGSRLRTVLEESEPSRRVIWRQRCGGDAQDTVPPWHKLATPTVPSSESRGGGMSPATLPTPNFEEIMEEQREFAAFPARIPKQTEEESRWSVSRKAEAVDLADRFKEQPSTSPVYLP